MHYFRQYIDELQVQGDKRLRDITIRQMLAIPAILHAPGGATINHIARTLGTTKQSAKQIVDAMAKKGYLSVTPSEVDRRAVSITVTPEGMRVFQACAARNDVFLADIFARFTADELQTLFTLLDKLYRFDGAAQDGARADTPYSPSDAQAALRYHPSFVERQRDHLA